MLNLNLKRIPSSLVDGGIRFNFIENKKKKIRIIISVYMITKFNKIVELFYIDLWLTKFM